MKQTQKNVALYTGILLLFIGTLAIFTEKNLLGNFFGSNIALGVLYVLLGSVSVYMGTKKECFAYNKAFGIIILLIGIVGFIPKINSPLVKTFGVNLTTSIFHLLIGSISLYTHYTSVK